MMAGRAAFEGQRYIGAIEHFTNLTSDLKCPDSLRAQAHFAYGDALMSLPGNESNKWWNYEQAVQVFRTIPQKFPNEQPVATLAWGEMGKCWKQIPGGTSNAVYAFSFVVASTNASIAARSEAQVTIASILVDQAHIDVASRELAENQKALVRQALINLLGVVYGQNLTDDRRDLFWVKKAASDAAPLLELLGDVEPMERLYVRMKDILPVLAPTWQRKIEQARERRSAEKNQPRI
jgi:hypothetical protein